MIDFSTLQALTVPEGVVTKIEKDGVVLWELPVGGSIVLEVKKITSNTYVGSTTYNGETFILLDIYPRSGGTVTVTYGDLTKTVVDDGTSEVPNAQEVFFGTYNGVTDEVETPDRGTLTIQGDCAAFGGGAYKTTSKSSTFYYGGFLEVVDFGSVEQIPDYAFELSKELSLSRLPDNIRRIGNYAFYYCESITITEIPEGVEEIGNYCFYMGSDDKKDPVTELRTMVFPSTLKSIGDHAFTFRGTTKEYGYLRGITTLAVVPPVITDASFGDPYYTHTITVPKGCGESYKAAAGWSNYADYIVEASE